MGNKFHRWNCETGGNTSASRKTCIVNEELSGNVEDDLKNCPGRERPYDRDGVKKR